MGTHTKFQLDILTTYMICVISGNVYFREIILESLWNVREILFKQPEGSQKVGYVKP